MTTSHRGHDAAPDWDTQRRNEELETRVRDLEFRAQTLETTLEHRLARIKAEMWSEIWEERLKGLFVISVGIAVVAWVRLLAG